MNRNFLIGLGIVLILVLGGLFLSVCQDEWCMWFSWQKARVVKSFEDCERLGSPVSESYPPQCRAGEMTFTKNIGNEIEKVDLIRVNWPRPGSTVNVMQPIVVRGEARGNWFFEASFPIFLKDGNGTIIGQGIAQAKGEWMTTDFVPYEAQVTFTKTPTTPGGVLRLEKDNPSGLPEHDDALEIPVVFEGS